jgi:hypothetical protein
MSGLSPSNTVVSRRLNFYPVKPETFIHENREAAEAIILQDNRNQIERLSAYRTFLDCFYYLCGYRLYYLERKNERRMSKFSPSADDEAVYTFAEKKRYIKYDAVMHRLGDIPHLTKTEAQQLVGRQAGTDVLNEAHHCISVRAVAIHLKRLFRTDFAGPSYDLRRQGIQKVFAWMTGYDTFEQAIANASETRSLTSEGLIDKFGLARESEEGELEESEERQVALAEVN